MTTTPARAVGDEVGDFVAHAILGRTGHGHGLRDAA
jgi:hypothetical protein